MRFLLINKNPAVSKLVSASLERIGLGVSEIGDYAAMGLETYVLIIVDSDSFRADMTDDLLALSLAPSLLYLQADELPVPSDIQYILKKPFLPTDFIAYLVSILQNTPELKRFITPEMEEFKHTVLKDQIPQQTVNNAPESAPAIPPHFEERTIEEFDQTPKKQAIFEPKSDEAPLAPFAKMDIFANLSDELGRLYSGADEGGFGEESPENIQSVEAESEQAREDAVNFDMSAEPTAFPPLDVEGTQSVEEAVEQIEGAGDEASSDEMFTLKDSDAPIVPDGVTVPIPSDAHPRAEEPIAEGEAEEKINFDFDIFDKIEEAPSEAVADETVVSDEAADQVVAADLPSASDEVAEPNISDDIAAAMGEITEDAADEVVSADNVSDEAVADDVKVASNESAAASDEVASETPADEHKDFGFGDLAKEFGDLIDGKLELGAHDEVTPAEPIPSEPKVEAVVAPEPTPSEPVVAPAPTPPEPVSTPHSALEGLSEAQMKTALQESGMLPPDTQMEVVKAEIQNVVAQSVQGALQSQILRDVFKGLKMNITITFEDK
jgi:uncharacterized membrane protein